MLSLDYRKGIITIITAIMEEMMGFGMMFVPLLLIGLIIYAIVRLAQGNHNHYHNHNGRNDAIEILNQRYAKGEISDEEYKQKKKILEER